MPILLSSEILQEKNKIASDEAFLVALEIFLPDVTDSIKIISNTEDITWRGENWIAFPFELDEISEEAKGEVPRVDLRISNVNREIESYLQEYGAYVKNNGYAEITVKIYVICTATLDVDDPIVEHEYILVEPKTDSAFATFTLGAANPYKKRFPQSRILKNHCRFKFKSERCGYSGIETSCNKTLTRCRVLNNSIRYGGFPGAGQGGLTIV